MSRKRLLVSISFCLIILSLLTVASLVWGYNWLKSWGEKSTELVSERIIEFPRGTTLESLALALYDEEIVSSDLLFRFWVREFSDYSKFQAGKYRFTDNVSPQLIAKTIQSGDIYEPVLYELSIPEGFTMAQIGEKVEQLELGSYEDFMALTSSEELISRYSINAKTLEGYLFPATYRLTEKLPLRDLFLLFLDTFFSRLPKSYVEDVEQKGLTLQEAITLASLIERETSNDGERSIVSEVIWNRLNKRIALAIDASIIYGIPNFDGNIRRKHLKDKKNLYNTRVHGGLPPGPICSPGTASLEAVLTPTNHGYYYYVVDAEDFSQHRFSRTLKEHNRNVGAYVRALKNRK